MIFIPPQDHNFRGGVCGRQHSQVISLLSDIGQFKRVSFEFRLEYCWWSDFQYILLRVSFGGRCWMTATMRWRNSRRLFDDRKFCAQLQVCNLRLSCGVKFESIPRYCGLKHDSLLHEQPCSGSCGSAAWRRIILVLEALSQLHCSAFIVLLGDAGQSAVYESITADGSPGNQQCSPVQYCASAWSGFCLAVDRTRLDTFARRCKRLNLITMTILCRSYRDAYWRLFS